MLLHNSNTMQQHLHDNNIALYYFYVATKHLHDNNITT